MQRFINNFSTTILATIAPSDTIIKIDEEHASILNSKLDGDYTLLTLDANDKIEIVKVVEVNGGELKVVRGMEYTIAYNWNIGARIEARITAGSLEDVRFDADSILTADGEVLVGPSGDVLIY